MPSLYGCGGLRFIWQEMRAVPCLGCTLLFHYEAVEAVQLKFAERSRGVRQAFGGRASTRTLLSPCAPRSEKALQLQRCHHLASEAFVDVSFPMRFVFFPPQPVNRIDLGSEHLLPLAVRVRVQVQ